MKLKPLAANQTEVEIGDYTVLFSYQTPVAYHKQGVGYFRTDRSYSKTTTRHVNSWLGSNGATAATQQAEAFKAELGGIGL